MLHLPYQPAPIPPNESERLAALRQYNVLDTLPEQDFDDLTQIASEICGAPIALVSLVDENRQFFKSRVGLEVSETPREFSFCSHVILNPQEMLIVPDSLQDGRFASNPLVQHSPHIRFYAGSPLVTPEGYAIGSFCVIDFVPRELTEQQKNCLNRLNRQVIAQLELRRHLQRLQEVNTTLLSLNQEKNEFLAMASHDLKNPLNVVVNLSELLQEDIETNRQADLLDYVVDIKSSAKQMFGLVTQFLDVQKIESNNLTSQCQATDFIRIINTVINRYRSASEKKQQEIIFSDSHHINSVFVMADTHLLEQVLDNLLSNAVKYSPKGGKITIELQSMSTAVQVAIKDQGIGLSEADKKQLFGKFKRLSTRPTGNEHSSGLGLFIVKKLVEAMRGNVWCESELGKGTTFFVSLPIAEKALRASLQEELN